MKFWWMLQVYHTSHIFCISSTTEVVWHWFCNFTPCGLIILFYIIIKFKLTILLYIVARAPYVKKGVISELSFSINRTQQPCLLNQNFRKESIKPVVHIDENMFLNIWIAQMWKSVKIVHSLLYCAYEGIFLTIEYEIACFLSPE